MLLPSRAAVQDVSTLRHGMEYLHSRFDVNFVYDSSLDLDVPYRGQSLKNAETLEESLTMLFTDSGIEFEIMRKYVVLTKAGSKKKPKDYTIFIEEQHDTLNESIVTALVDPKRNATQTGLKRIDSSDLNSGFALFSTPDVIKTLQLLPGVSSGTELLSGFYVHGGDGTDNLFLMDGVPIYQMSHLLGLFSSFNTDVIGSMDFYKSGFPARYGSKLSSVVDVTTRDGDFEEFHGTFAIGLIDGRFQLEGPLWKGKTSFNFGLRRTWLETLSIPVLAIVNKVGVDSSESYKDIYNVRYAFTDLNAKITHKFSDTNVLSANFYTGRDVFRFCNDYEDKGLNGGDYTRYVTELPLSWGNVIGSLNWNYDFNDSISMKNMAYYSGSLSDMHFTDRTVRDYVKDVTAGVYMNSDVHNIGVKSDFHHVPSSNHILRYGGTLQYHIYCPNTTAKTDVVQDNVSSTFVAYSDSLRYDTFEGSLYAEDEIAVNEDFSVNAGLRYSVYATQGKAWHSLEPRLAMKYSFNDRITAKASYTEMSQPSHLISSLYLDLPTNAWLPSTAKVAPGRSREVAGGLYTELAHNMHLNVEGWYKHMYNLIEYAGAYNFFPPLNGWEDF